MRRTCSCTALRFNAWRRAARASSRREIACLSRSEHPASDCQPGQARGGHWAAEKRTLNAPEGATRSLRIPPGGAALLPVTTGAASVLVFRGFGPCTASSSSRTPLSGPSGLGATDALFRFSSRSSWIAIASSRARSASIRWGKHSAVDFARSKCGPSRIILARSRGCRTYGNLLTQRDSRFSRPDKHGRFTRVALLMHGRPRVV